MEKNVKNTMFKFALLMVAALVTFSACDRDDDDDDPVNGIPAEDGFYVTGPATGYTELQFNAMMNPGREEGEGFASNPRTGMYEKYMYLSSGDFNIIEKSGATEDEFGWVGGTQETFDPEGEGDEVSGPVHSGQYETGGASFNAPEDGFYHIVLDESTGMVYYIRIRQWALIGDATDQGWSAEYPMEQTNLSATSAEWEVTDLVLRERGGFKFRYNEGWKITTDDFIIFANIGAEPGTNNFRTGGDLFPYPTEGEGQYTVTLTWTIADGFSYNTVRTGDVDPLPEYPAELYMIGDGVGSWEWDEVDIPMIPTAGNKDHLFWRIVWLEETGAFKFAEQRAWVGDFGKTDDATDGVYETGGEDIPVPGEAGYYMVVVNLETNQVAIADPQVYLIGATVDDNWDTANPDARFTVDNDNEVLTLTRELSAGELRMYAWFDTVDDWFTDWWHHEFMIFNGDIEYRGRGDDQERIMVEAGETTIELNFRTDEGSITQD